MKNLLTAFACLISFSVISQEIESEPSTDTNCLNNISLKKGEGYYSNLLLAYNSITYGVTDNITIGGVLTPWGGFLASKAVFQTEEADFSVGLIGFQPFGGYMTNSESFGFASAKFGFENSTFSINYVRSLSAQGSEFGKDIINLSALIQLNTKKWLKINLCLLTPDNLPQNAFINSVGIRSKSKKRKAYWDLGLVLFTERRVTIPLPYIGYAIPF